MLTSVKGTYDQGKITLAEEPPVTSKAEVIITFLTQETPKPVTPRKIILGLLEGKAKLPDDFDEPMEDLKEYM